MPKFLILQSPNKGNVGTITERSEDFYKPTFYKITEEELETFTAMNAHAKAAYIAEKLEAQIGTPTQVKKKVAPIVEVAESQVEPVLVEKPETEVEEPLNEPENEVKEEISESEYNEIKEEFKPVVDEMINNVVEEITKTKGRPKKVK